ncbi:MAG: trigger factor [Clostridia bacterium]|nr:trigger factor [Clostridia bacterium]
MKKTAVIALLLAALLFVTGCAQTYGNLNPNKYVQLGEYKGLTYTPVSVEVSDYELQVAINTELKDSGYVTYDEKIELKEGTVQLGDTVNINYKGLMDGVAFEGGTAEKQSLTIGSGQFIDGFEEGLVGKAIGSDVSLNLTFPENYGNAELAGKAVVFEVKINSVTERAHYKELTDELAHTMRSELNTAEEFKNAVKEELTASKKASAEDSIKNALWVKVINNAEIKKLPEKLVKETMELYNAQFESAAIQAGYNTVDQYVAANGLTEEKYQELLRSYAEPFVQDRVIALAIAQKEGYEPTKEQIQATAEKYAAQGGYPNTEKFIEDATEEEVRILNIMDHVIDLVLENAKTA